MHCIVIDTSFVIEDKHPSSRACIHVCWSDCLFVCLHHEKRMTKVTACLTWEKWRKSHLLDKESNWWWVTMHGAGSWVLGKMHCTSKLVQEISVFDNNSEVWGTFGALKPTWWQNFKVKTSVIVNDTKCNQIQTETTQESSYFINWAKANIWVKCILQQKQCQCGSLLSLHPSSKNHCVPQCLFLFTLDVFLFDIARKTQRTVATLFLLNPFLLKGAWWN